MLTEMPRTSVPIVEHSSAIEISPRRVSRPRIGPIVVSAALCFVLLHFVTGTMIGGSQARPSIEPAALVALDSGAKCLPEARALEPRPNVWSLGSD